LSTVLTKTLISIGIFFTLFSFASADYEVFTVNEIPANQPIASVNDYQMVGFSSGNVAVIEYITDAKVTQFDRLTLPFCRNGGSNGGTIYLEVRSTATSGPIVASSTLTVNSGNVWNTGCTSSIINATSSTFVLNQRVQWESGGTFYFLFRAVGTTGTYYLSFDVNNGSNGKYLGTSASPPTWLGQNYYTSMTGYALGVPPVVYNASSSNVSCETFDFGCYFSQALNYAFYPDQATLDGFENLNFASSSPFGYITDMDSALQTFMTALNATSSSFKITLDMTTLDNTSSVFNGISTSSIEVFNICWVNRAIGELPANSFSNKMLPMIVFMMWIGLGWLFYSVAHKIW